MTEGVTRMSQKRKGSGKSPHKRFTIGFETEFLIIDKNGNIAPGADAILKIASDKAGDRGHIITKECAENMIELGSYPDIKGSNTMKSLLDGLKLLTYAANEAGYMVLPLATYPGRFKPWMRKEFRYKVQAELFGKTRFDIAGRVVGYHCHYALPWGVFDQKTLMLKNLSDSKNQEYMVNAFNFLIAADPALTTLMQSSPFYQGRHLAKDSRVLVYRGGEDVDYPKGLYAKMPDFGSLPRYVHAGTDIISRVEERYKKWIEALKTAGVSDAQMPHYRSILDTNWRPLKVNAHGTFEQRGMDMNHLPILLSVSVLLQIIVCKIQDGDMKVVPHDSAKAEPFYYDDKERTLYIPPDTHVIKHLQKLSAYEGLAHDEMWYYCKRLVGLAKLIGGESLAPLLQPLSTMLSERMTTSDKILAQARALGHKSTRKVLPQSIAAEIALSHAKQMFEDMVIIEKMIDAGNGIQTN